jgi:hypothetical protein
MELDLINRKQFYIFLELLLYIHKVFLGLDRVQNNHRFKMPIGKIIVSVTFLKTFNFQNSVLQSELGNGCNTACSPLWSRSQRHKKRIAYLLLDMETQSSCQKFHCVISGILVRVFFINHFETSFRTLNLLLDVTVCSIAGYPFQLIYDRK